MIDGLFRDSLAEHGVYGWTPTEPTAYWAIGTSAFYALLFKVFGVVYWPIVVANIVLGTLLVAVTMGIATSLRGERVGVVAGGLIAVWPSLIMYTTVAASELLFMLLTAGAVLVWLRGGGSPWVRGGIVGILLGMATLVRPIAVLLPIMLAASLIWVPPANRKVAETAAVLGTVVLVMAIVIAPWTFRNYKVFGTFVLVSTNGAPNFWMGNNPNTTGGYMPLPQRVEKLDEVARSRELGSEAVNYVKERPDLFLLRTAIKALKLHMRESIASAWTRDGVLRSSLAGLVFPLWLLSNVFWCGVLISAVGGVILLFLESGRFAPFYLPFVHWLYFTGVHAVTVADDRYHFPAIPFIAIFAATFLMAMWTRFQRREPDTPQAVG